MNTQQTSQQLELGLKVDQTAPKRRKHLYIIGAIVATSMMIFGAGAAMAYTFWYQQPDKVVNDTFLNALTAHTASFTGSVDTVNGETKLKTDFDGALADDLLTTHAKTGVTSGAISLTVDGSLQTGPNGSAYVKVANARELTMLVMQLMDGQSNGSLSDLVNKVDNKWVKITPQDVGEGNIAASAKGLRCLTQAVDAFQGNAAARQEVTDLYSQHRFIIIKQSLGEQNGSLGFKLGADSAQARAFVAGLKDTQMYGIMRSCDGSFDIDENAVVGDGSHGVKDVEIWTSTADHQLTAVKVTGGQNGNTFNVVFKPTFNKEVTIATPSDAVTVDELRQDIQSLVAH